MSLSLIAAFLIVFTWVLLSIALASKFLEARRKRQVTAIVETVDGGQVAVSTKLLKDPAATSRSGWEPLLERFQLVHDLEKQIQQAGLDWTPARLLLRMGCGGLLGAVLATLLPVSMPSGLPSMSLACVFASLPYLYLRRKRARRLAECEEQLPEALDFLARSMRAGHAFTISLEMLSEELAAPLGLEFRTLFNEHNLGAGLQVALRNLTERAPLLDIRFFASAVMMQRQTGGNLSEILNRLAYVIRERFRLKGQVRAASAHGRMTAMILTALPLVTMLALLVVAPGYLQSMAADPDGKYLIGGCAGAQVLGNLVIRKIIKIKV